MAGGQDKMAMDRAEYNRMRKEIERLECSLAISKGKHKNAIREIERLRDEIETYQQREDEIIVALGSQGITPAGIVPTIERLRAALERIEVETSDEYTKEIVREARRND